MQIKLDKKIKKNSYKFYLSVFFLLTLILFFLFFIFFVNESNKKISNFLINSAHRFINQIYLPNEIETIKIDINFKNYQILKENRKIAHSNKLAERENFKWVKATISINQKKFKAKIRLKGTHSDHYNDPKKWSFNIKLKNKTYNGIARFTIQPPKTSEFLNEWFFQKAIYHEQLISRRTGFYNVIVNGHRLGLYFFQEGISKELIENNYLREGPVLSYDKSLWVKNVNKEISTDNSFFDSDIEVDYLNKIKSSQMLFKDLAVKKLEKLRQANVNLDEIIDVEKFAKLMMLYTLMGSDEFDWRDIKFYYNPITGLLEPIGKELHIFKDNNMNLTYQLGKVNSKYEKNQKDFHEIFFKNEQFKKIYFSELNKAIKNNLIQKIINQNKQEFNRFSKILNNYYFFYKNEKIFDKKISKTVEDIIKTELFDKLNDYEDSSDENEINQFSKKYKSLNLFDLDNEKKQIIFKNGDHIIHDQIIFPKNYTTLLKPGTKITFKDNGSFIFKEAIKFVGEKNNQIELLSENDKNKTHSNYISVIKAKQNSIIEFCNFRNLSAPSERSGKGFLGSLNFYESNVKIVNSSFVDNLNGDDYINIVRSKFKIQNIIFENVMHDALDSDFSYGQINNLIAINVLNDGLDFSGSTVEIQDINLDTISDKGISIGENSKITVKNYKIKNSNIGFASKDLSKLIGNNIVFENLKIGIAIYQKKKEFGPAEAIIHDLNVINVKDPFLVQKNSKLEIDSNKIQTTNYKYEDL